MDLQVLTLFILASKLVNGFDLDTNYLLNFKEKPSNVAEEKWIDQPLDHFDKNENRTLKMKYFENLELWKPSGPIYVYVGGSTKASGVSIEHGIGSIIDELAVETNGAMLATEHRYYGDSWPRISNDVITDYYKYLSSRQALEDIAHLIRTIKSDPKYKSSKVVVIGGSYAGSLAAWMRALYPDLVDAAIASSAPLLAKKDFHEYLDNVRNTLSKYGSEDCLKNIQNEFDKYELFLRSTKMREILKEELSICPDNDLSVLENQQYLFYCSYSQLTSSVYGSPKDIQNQCKSYNVDSLKLSRFSRPFLKSSLTNQISKLCRGDGCLDLNFTSLTLTDPWTYQQCTEFGYFPTTTSEQQPFVRWNPIDFELKFCKHLVGGDIGKKVDKAVANTNKIYGGLHPNVTKVVFSNGDMDPWHALGVLKDLGPDAKAVVINGTSHDALLLPPSPYLPDPEKLVEKKKYVKQLVKTWISSK